MRALNLRKHLSYYIKQVYLHNKIKLFRIFFPESIYSHASFVSVIMFYESPYEYQRAPFS